MSSVPGASYPTELTLRRTVVLGRDKSWSNHERERQPGSATRRSLFKAYLQEIRGIPNVDLTDLRNINATPISRSDATPIGRSDGDRRSPVLDPAFWDVARSSQLTGEKGQSKRVEFLVSLACSKDSAPHVARGLIRIRSSFSTGTEVSGPPSTEEDPLEQQLFADGLQKRKSDPTACQGLIGLTDGDWLLLNRN